MSWTLCTSGSAIFRASVNANSNMVSYVGNYKIELDQWNDEAEAYAVNLARYDVVTNYSNLTSAGVAVFSQLTSSMIAQKIINYDPDAIGRSTATLILNILENDINNAKSIITDKNNKTYLGIAS